MNSIVRDTLDKLRQCDDFHNRCDCLLEHSEITYLLEYIINLETTLDRIKKIIENEKITGIEAKLMIKDILEEKK